MDETEEFEFRLRLEQESGPSLKQSNPAEYDPSSSAYQKKYGAASGGGLENFAAGAGKFLADIGQGAKQRLGFANEQDESLRRERDAPLMATKSGKAGYIGGGVGFGAPLLAIPGANSVAGAAALGGVTGALQPTVEGESVAKNTVLGAGLGGVGQKLGSVVTNKVGQKVAERAALKAENSVRDATLAEARKAGYSVPPSHANPTVTNRALESISGKAATQQSATVRNQKVTNSLIRKDLGLAGDAPLTVGTLKGVRDSAGKVYEGIKKSGDIATDSQYLDELVRLSESADEVAKDFPDLNFASSAEVKKLQDGLQLDRFSPNGAIEAMKKLRNEASGNLAWNVDDPAKKALGLAQREAAGIIEDQVIRHLRANGKGALADQFDKARMTIAKAHSAQSALNQATGNINAGKLAAQLRKGKPFSGGMATAAKFASAFPKAAGEQLSSPGVSAVDALVAGGLGTMVDPTLFALPLARYAARGTVLSKPFQNALATPSYGSNALRALGAGAPLAPTAGVVIPGYLQQQ